ncbi:hypothetical protein CHS0354_014994 [Potamilus streckersoni]|uniref:Uncharacterized protein n=1 Tax=Potamilus streckersoni TaxID=2493646 RepID=A0AAE0VR80_9BIVA|nr:hypothetical protein CHS0354_014994 [Potamilus streckersoni]
MYRQLQVNLEKYIEPDIYRTLRVDGKLQREEAMEKLEAAGISENDIKGMYREGENALCFNTHQQTTSHPTTQATKLPTTTPTSTSPMTSLTAAPTVVSATITSPSTVPPPSVTLPPSEQTLQIDTPLDEDPATHTGDKRELFDMNEYKWTVVTNKKARIQKKLSGERNMEC